MEVIELVEQMMFNTGNAVKYLMRAGEKTPDRTEDLNKALWYVNREIARRDGHGFIRRIILVVLKSLPQTNFYRQDAYRVLWSRVLTAETRVHVHDALLHLYSAEKPRRSDEVQRESLVLAVDAIRDELATCASSGPSE